MTTFVGGLVLEELPESPRSCLEKFSNAFLAAGIHERLCGCFAPGS